MVFDTFVNGTNWFKNIPENCPKMVVSFLIFLGIVSKSNIKKNALLKKHYFTDCLKEL